MKKYMSCSSRHQPVTPWKTFTYLWCKSLYVSWGTHELSMAMEGKPPSPHRCSQTKGLWSLRPFRHLPGVFRSRPWTATAGYVFVGWDEVKKKMLGRKTNAICIKWKKNMLGWNDLHRICSRCIYLGNL